MKYWTKKFKSIIHLTSLVEVDADCISEINKHLFQTTFGLSKNPTTLNLIVNFLLHLFSAKHKNRKICSLQ